MVQLSATMEQTHETQLYDMLGFPWVIVHYDVLSTIHETGPRTVGNMSDNNMFRMSDVRKVKKLD